MSKIKREFTFQAGVYFDSKFILNLYNIDTLMYVETEDMEDQNIAIERMKFYIYECIENSVFVYHTETEMIKKFIDANIKVCVLPVEPYEQMIAAMLLNKLNAIIEGRLTIVEISILSKLSDGVKIIYDIEQSAGPFEEVGWWNNKKIVVNELKITKKEDNVLKIISNSNSSWDDIGLAWKEQQETQNQKKATIVTLKDGIEQ